jgi:hypothetical protein
VANYPTALPSTTPTNHGQVVDEIVAIATTLGLNPQGGTGSVATRLAALAPPVCLVVSADAPSAYRTAAAGMGGTVFVCDGTDDQVQIQAAIDLAAALSARTTASPAGAQQWGLVQLTGGRFNISSAVLCRTAVRLTGAGWLTELRAVGCNSGGLLMLASVNEHLVQVDNLYLDGNDVGGGTCSAIDFVMTGSTDAGVATYPDSNPDAYHKITDLFIRNFETTASSMDATSVTTNTRHGIRLFCTTTANQRGWIIDRIQMRRIDGNGIIVNSSSDGYLTNTHLGSIRGSGYVITSANVKMSNNKAFYCNGWGLDWQSGQGICTGFEAQDSHKGVYAAGRQGVMTNIIIDCCRDEGMVVDASRQMITGVSVTRSAARYTTMTYGIRYVSGSDCTVIGMVDTVSITTRLSGTFPAGSFVRINGSGTVTAVG